MTSERDQLIDEGLRINKDRRYVGYPLSLRDTDWIIRALVYLLNESRDK